MNIFFKKILFLLASQIGKVLPITFIERIYAVCIIKQKLRTDHVKIQHINREYMWDEIFQKFENIPINIFEFGVFEGYSMRWFAQKMSHKDSRFYGFDSFEGLPESWSGSHPQYTFDLSGRVPIFKDQRIILIKGWFQNTVASFLKIYSTDKQLIVHFDADLYSSTLYILMELDRLKKSYLGIFDEFRGDEARALYNYAQATGATVEILARTEHRYFPAQVAARISPCGTYEPGGGGARRPPTQDGEARA